MNKHHIQAIGHFLSTYQNDLKYISRFQDYKKGKIQPNQYVKKEDGSFYKFLIEFKVIRSITKGTSINLLEETEKWIDGRQSNNVDAFAIHLKNIGITRGESKSMTSKILFLNNPTKIIPMDTLTRNSLNLMQNNYNKYIVKLNSFTKSNRETLDLMMDHVNPFCTIIHKDFTDIQGLETIARNRMIDKLLWTLGG